MQTTAHARKNAPLALPPDVAELLSRWRLTLPGLLTDSNPKLAKGEGRAVILHHLPARALGRALTPDAGGPVAARNYLPGLAELAARHGMITAGLNHHGCPWATACEADCLAFSGRGGLGVGPADARARRTLAMISDPATYGRAVLWAIAWHHRRAADAAHRLAVRLRGTDEGPAVGWHRLRLPITAPERLQLARRFGLEVPAAGGPGDPDGGANLADLAGHAVSLYDYSKAPLAGPLGLEAQRAAGWDITASMAPDAADAARRAIDAARAGFRVAVPVALRKGQRIPQALTLRAQDRQPITLTTVDGDATDHRYREPGGVAVILRAKRSRGGEGSGSAFFLRAPDAPRRDHRAVTDLPDGVAALWW
jgi:hypothetical protein